MNLNELKAALRAAPANGNVGLELPDGRAVPAHFHVTEVGHIRKDFIDCGGKSRASRTCLLQTWMAGERDDGHRLTAGKLGKILGLAAPLFADDAVPVEIEHEDGIISQYPLEAVERRGRAVVLRLGRKHTDCLAREKCGADEGGACGCAAAPTAACCNA
ncbi:MAG TPA: DUF6428 family protein [Opitutaceae bacterium]|nr:DUF6428 family protein [Opitutaceae bacterium]